MISKQISKLVTEVRIGILVASLMCSTAIAADALRGVSSVDAAVAFVADSYAAVTPKLGPNPSKNITGTLMWLGANDQAGREALHTIDLKRLSTNDQSIALKAIWQEINKHDVEDQKILKSILPRNGWFSEKRYGPAAAEGAFLVVQHATDDILFQRDILHRLGAAVGSGDVSGEEYSLLFDRVALAEGQPQRYGTQMICDEGRWVPAPVENTANLSALRNAMGFKQSFSDYVKSFDDAPACHSK